MMAIKSIRSVRTALLAGCAMALTMPMAAAQDDVTDDVAEDETEAERMVVTGRRVSEATAAVGVDEASNTISVTRDALLSAPSGVSGLKALEGIPGFNVQTDGALGLYEFGNSVTVRAFNFEQIGFVLDGIPMGRPDPFGGSPIFRYVDNENLQRVRASIGAGDVTLPSATSLGPIVEYITTEPAEEFSAVLSITLGDDNLNRSFARIDSGKIGGFSGYISRSKTDSDLWRGPGTIDREHIEAKAQYEFGDSTLLRGIFVYNDFFDYDSPSMSRAQYESPTGDAAGRTGRDRAYLGTVPDLGFGPDVAYQSSGYTQYYIDRINVREDLLIGATLTSALTDTISINATGYWENKDGFGVSPDSYSNTLNNYREQEAAGIDMVFGTPLVAPRGVQYGLSTVGGDRYGAVAGLTWQIANHTVQVGGWWESETYNRTQLRLNKEGGNPAGRVLFKEVAYYRRNYESERDFLQFYLKDTWRLLDDRLTIEAGFKSLFLDYKLDGFRDFDDYSRANPAFDSSNVDPNNPLVDLNGNPRGIPGFGPQVIEVEFDDAFLPMVGAVFDITDTEQVFASYAQNFALPREADALYDNIAVPAVDEGERSTNYEIGFRTNRPTINAAIAAYYVEFENRIEVAGRPVPGQDGAIESVAQNVGAVNAYGIEFTTNWKPEFLGDYVYFTSNVTYNVAEFQDDFRTGSGTFLGLDGNELPDSPQWLFTLGVTVEPTEWLVANVTTRYTGERFADFINTQEMEGFAVVDAYIDIGDGFEGIGPLKNIKLRINGTNLTDKDTLSFTFTTVSGTAFYRPLAPRTFQFTVTGVF